MTHNNNSMDRYLKYLTHRDGATAQLACPCASLQPCPVYLYQPAQVAARSIIKRQTSSRAAEQSRDRRCNPIRFYRLLRSRFVAAVCVRSVRTIPGSSRSVWCSFHSQTRLKRQSYYIVADLSMRDAYEEFSFWTISSSVSMQERRRVRADIK